MSFKKSIAMTCNDKTVEITLESSQPFEDTQLTITAEIGTIKLLLSPLHLRLFKTIFGQAAELQWEEQRG